MAVASPQVFGAQQTDQGTGSNLSNANRTSGQQAVIVIKDGLLTVKADSLSLARLADELSQKAGIAVILQDDAGNQSVSGNFENLPLDQGLRLMLTKQDVFLFYGVDNDQPSSLKAVWIYPKGRGRGVAPVPADKWQSTKEISAMLKDSDPAMRIKAINELVDRKGKEARDAVLEAIGDDNQQVRSNALYAAMKSDIDLPQGKLTDLALHDDSADVRFLALQALTTANSSDLRAAAEQAANDPNEAVRNAAQEALSRLGPLPAADQGQPEPSTATKDQNQPQSNP